QRVGNPENVKTDIKGDSVIRTLALCVMLSILSTGLFGCSGSSSSAPSAGIKPNPNGKVMEATEVSVLSAERLVEAKNAMGLATTFKTKGNCGAKLYRVTYRTPGVLGDQRNASGLLVVPTGVTTAPVASYQHGTTTSRKAVPSNLQSPEAMLLAMIYGNACYIVVAADYLGLGADPGLHPYLHADTEASATADMLAAGLSYLPRTGITWNNQLFLVGYSQGGHVTMALHRSLQQQPISGVSVTASAPMAGPYDLSETSVRQGLRSGSDSIPMYASYIVLAMRLVYQIYPNLEDAFLPSYTGKLASLFDGNQSNQQVVDALPKTAAELFQSRFFDDVNSTDLNPLRTALKKNDVYEWVPAAPMRLYHGSNDQDVPFENCNVASKYMKDRGADVQCTNVGYFTHLQAFVPAMANAFHWFESLKGSSQAAQEVP
ncbi:MAG: lipase family protein, partial [Bdellovibrionales bacterium]|nr:lipase family protein [Bdellovibrionales bacterium]